jgi:hypothetical protein
MQKYTLLFLILSLGIISCQQDTDVPSSNRPAAEEKAPANARFERMGSDVTGVNFSNRITENHQVNILTNSYMYNGGGVGIIDVNNDQLPDLYFVSTQESNKLYLNEGNLKFKDITESAGVTALGGFKTGVTIVDINQDGFDDIYVCRTGVTVADSRRNLLYINNGDQTFSEQAAAYGLDDKSASNHASFFDYDKDGDLDMYLLNHPVDFEYVNQITLSEETGRRYRKSEPKTPYDSDRLYRNDGNGKFTDMTEQAGLINRAFGLSVSVTDFNRDGYPDLFIGNDYIEPDFLYINNKNGSFTNQIDEYMRHTSNHTMGVDIADYNNDGLADLVALDMIAEDNRRQKLLMTTMALSRYATLAKYGYGHQVMRNVLQLNNGDESFSEVGTFAGVSNTDWSWSALMADYDNDGYKDLYITNGYRRDVTNLDYLTYTVDSIKKTGGLTSDRFPNFDDYLNLIPSEPLQNYMFQNNGDLTFEKVSTLWGFPEKSFSNGSAYADLDGDGDLELVTNNIDQEAFVYKNRTREQDPDRHYLAIQLKGPKGNPEGIGATVQLYYGDDMQYQEMMPTRGFLSSGLRGLHFGLGSTTTIDRLRIQWSDGKVEELSNVAADQNLELDYSNAGAKQAFGPDRSSPQYFSTASNTGINFQHQENEFEDFDRERLIPHRLSRLGPNISVGDVNGDQLDDVYIGGAAGQSGQLFVQQPNSSFRPASGGVWAVDAAYEDGGSIFFDADGDGDQDLYIVSGGSAFPINSTEYQDRLYLNDGSGNFQKAGSALPKMTSSGYCVSVHDFDGDGDQDVFVGGRVSPGEYPRSPISYILQNDGGTFAEVTKTVCPEFRNIGMVADIQWGDLNGDQQEEMIVAGEWMPITIFSNEQGTFKNVSAQYGMDQTNGWWNCLALQDMDGDGDLDILGGNLGLNTRLKASADEPLKLMAHDFDRNGSIEPIITYFNDGKEYPLVRRENLIVQIPEIKKKYVYFDPYSSATVSEVFDKEEIKKAQTYFAKTFETTYFSNQGGSFEPQALPEEAQIAPTYKILTTDLNGDQKPDLLLVGNNYHADVETGRYDAGNGTILLNKGAGSFDPVRNITSGLWATKDVKDLEAVRLANGKTLYLIANNNDRIEAYVSK